MADAQPMECVYPTGMVERTIVLHSADNGKLMLGEPVALRLDMLRNKIINNCDGQPTISLSGTKFATLATVIDYCTHLVGLSASENFLSQCNKQIHLVNLFNLVQVCSRRALPPNFSNLSCLFFIIGCAVFVVGATATYFRFLPYIKKNEGV